jgi:hypothetical protein
VDLDKDALKKMFPNLAKELQSDSNRVPVNSVRTDLQTGENATAPEKFVHYVPDVIDFIRRCDTREQAEEIIAYMEEKGEIDKQYAVRLREQLVDKGVRSFGPKKKEGYYLSHGAV